MNVQYVKYSIDRHKKFQIKTTLLELEEKKIARKEAVYPEGAEHIKKMFHNYALLNGRNGKLHYAPPTLNSNAINFPFIYGDSLDSLMYKCVKEKNLDNLMDYFLQYQSIFRNEEIINFVLTDQFSQVFGNIEGLENKSALTVANVDLNYENIIVDENTNLQVIDYEWVMDFPVPVGYILYRVTRNFFGKYGGVASRVISFEDVLKQLGIDGEEAELFLQMERNFRSYTGHNWTDLSKKYKKKGTNLIDLIRANK